MSKRLWKLIQLNVVYANGNSAVNKKGKTQSLNAAFSVVLLGYPLILVMSIALGYVLFPVWKVMPELFFTQIVNFLAMAFGLTLFYSFSTFFKSRDFEHYLYYPFTKNEVFYGKLFAILTVFSPFVLLTGAIGFSFGLAINGIIAGILQMLLNIALGSVVFLLTVLFVFFIGTHDKLKKMSTFLLGLGFGIFMLSIMFVSMSGSMSGGMMSSLEGTIQSNIENMPVLNTYYQMMQSAPFFILVMTGVLLGVCYCIFTLLKKQVAKKYLQNISQEVSIKKKSVTYSAKKISKTLFQHNFNLIASNKQYLMMLGFMMIVFSFVLAGPIIGLRNLNLSGIEYAPLLMMVGIFLVILVFLYPVSEHLYSLERENLEYIYALPLTRKQVFEEKRRFALSISMIPLTLYIGVISFTLNIGLFNTFVFAISTIIFNYLYQTYYLLQDEKSPNLNWATEMDLLQGGMQTFIRVLRYYGMIILFFILFAIFFFTTQFWWVEVILLIIAYGLVFYFFKKYQTKRGF